MDQGGSKDGGKLTSLPPLLSLEEPATWLVGAELASALGGWGGSALGVEVVWLDEVFIRAIDLAPSEFAAFR